MHIVTAKEMYEIDRYAMEEVGIDGKILMENAGRAVAAKIVRVVDQSQSVFVLIGSGNNGGDGFVIARTLLNDNYHVDVLQLVPDGKVTGDAAYHKQLFIRSGGSVIQFYESDNNTQLSIMLSRCDVVIDAMLGIGVSGGLKSPFDTVVEEVNDTKALKIAVDVPSGIPAGEGFSGVIAIKADFTFVIEAPKISTFLQQSAPYYGKWEVVEIGIPSKAFHHHPYRKHWGKAEVHATFPKRERFSHKGSHGKGLIIGGAREMPGSVTMTTTAALRAGSGLITVGTIQEVVPSIVSHSTEATYSLLASENGRITNGRGIDTAAFDAIAIGMGMGREPETSAFTRAVITGSKVPTLIDADGLHHVKDNLAVLHDREAPSILTPHPGEMAMLMDKSVAEVLQNPFTLAKQFSTRYQVFVILKGAFTIISDPEGNQWVNTSGNAGLAKGGSGDVLSGILLAMLMQDQTTEEALGNGCFIHGKAAAYQVEHEHSKQDLLATDVINGLASVFRTFSE